jgi:asparagine synthase (glutamine-hydrolysing)
MCGINGAIDFTGRFEITEPYIAEMRDTMSLRGPDGTGVWISADRRVGLGHRRLSIIDLSHLADQPMANEDGRLQVVFNGEIYNHAAIRAELEAIGGHQWRTDHSDTEVILHAFEEWGIDALHRFRGMFAFALWDGRARELWLVRDRIGVKPLYYSVHDGRLVFGSEIKALLKDPQQKRAIDRDALFHYLSFIATPAPLTMFEGIRKLPSGHLLRVQMDGTIEERRWYDMLEHTRPLSAMSDGDLEETLRATLREAVQCRRVSDVPLGVFLSGGVDSSTNVALFGEHPGTELKTFSAGYDGNYPSNPSELPHAAMVAALFKTRHFEAHLSVDDLIDFLPTMVRLQDEPIADPVCFPLYYLSKLARSEGVIVCQIGEGADELFFGYELWRRKWRLQQFGDRSPQLIKQTANAMFNMSGMSGLKSADALSRDVANQPIFWGTSEIFTNTEKHALLSPRLRTEFRGRTSWEVIAPFWKHFQEASHDQSWSSWMSYVDLSTRIPELLLMRLDKMMMGASVEGREPFLDHKLIEFVLGVPEDRRIPNGDLKGMLKRSMRGIVPDSVLDRRKQGFGVPVSEWMMGRLGEKAHALVSEFCRATDLLDPTAVDSRLAGSRDVRLWYLYNLALWWEANIK